MAVERPPLTERLKLRHLHSVSLRHACPDPARLRRAGVRDEPPADGSAVVELELERVGLQVAVFCVHGDASGAGAVGGRGGAGACIARGDAFLCYRTETQWGSLSPEFAPIARESMVYIAANGAPARRARSRRWRGRGGSGRERVEGRVPRAHAAVAT